MGVNLVSKFEEKKFPQNNIFQDEQINLPGIEQPDRNHTADGDELIP
jgi:hypothetical protein